MKSYKRFMDELGANPPVPFTDFSTSCDKRLLGKEQKRLNGGKWSRGYDPSVPKPVQESSLDKNTRR